jgi:hypothetical protein
MALLSRLNRRSPWEARFHACIGGARSGAIRLRIQTKASSERLATENFRKPRALQIGAP